MAKPYKHAESSARQYEGSPEDYLAIHDLMDSSKGAIPSNIHRALTHTSWFLSTILEKIFGTNITNSEGKLVSVRSIGEQHILEDFGFIPTPQDFFENCEYQDWMHGRGLPPSMKCMKKPREMKTKDGASIKVVPVELKD